jgi:gluconate 2-dehydrogenase alpha chain
MPRKLPSKDVVTGLCWAGSIRAQELTEARIEVAAIERGPWRDAATKFSSNDVQDELRPEQPTFAFRNKTRRFPPSDFMLRTYLTQRLEPHFPPQNLTIADWGVSYADLGPFYDGLEYLRGASGAAGDMNGAIRAGGDPFDEPRSRPCPIPSLQQPFSHALFCKTAFVGDVGEAWKQSCLHSPGARIHG